MAINNIVSYAQLLTGQSAAPAALGETRSSRLNIVGVQQSNQAPYTPSGITEQQFEEVRSNENFIQFLQRNGMTDAVERNQQYLQAKAKQAKVRTRQKRATLEERHRNHNCDDYHIKNPGTRGHLDSSSKSNQERYRIQKDSYGRSYFNSAHCIKMKSEKCTSDALATNSDDSAQTFQISQDETQYANQGSVLCSYKSNEQIRTYVKSEDAVISDRRATEAVKKCKTIFELERTDYIFCQDLMTTHCENLLRMVDLADGTACHAVKSYANTKYIRNFMQINCTGQPIVPIITTETVSNLVASLEKWGQTTSLIMSFIFGAMGTGMLGFLLFVFLYTCSPAQRAIFCQRQRPPVPPPPLPPWEGGFNSERLVDQIDEEEDWKDQFGNKLEFSRAQLSEHQSTAPDPAPGMWQHRTERVSFLQELQGYRGLTEEEIAGKDAAIAKQTRERVKQERDIKKEYGPQEIKDRNYYVRSSLPPLYEEHNFDQVTVKSVLEENKEQYIQLIEMDLAEAQREERAAKAVLHNACEHDDKEGINAAYWILTECATRVEGLQGLKQRYYQAQSEQAQQQNAAVSENAGANKNPRAAASRAKAAGIDDDADSDSEINPCAAQPKPEKRRSRFIPDSANQRSQLNQLAEASPSYDPDWATRRGIEMANARENDRVENRSSVNPPESTASKIRFSSAPPPPPPPYLFESSHQTSTTDFKKACDSLWQQLTVESQKLQAEQQEQLTDEILILQQKLENGLSETDHRGMETEELKDQMEASIESKKNQVHGMVNRGMASAIEQSLVIDTVKVMAARLAEQRAAEKQGAIKKRPIKRGPITKGSIPNSPQPNNSETLTDLLTQAIVENLVNKQSPVVKKCLVEMLTAQIPNFQKTLDDYDKNIHRKAMQPSTNAKQKVAALLATPQFNEPECAAILAEAENTQKEQRDDKRKEFVDAQTLLFKSKLLKGIAAAMTKNIEPQSSADVVVPIVEVITSKIADMENKKLYEGHQVLLDIALLEKIVTENAASKAQRKNQCDLDKQKYQIIEKELNEKIKQNEEKKKKTRKEKKMRSTEAACVLEMQPLTTAPSETPEIEVEKLRLNTEKNRLKEIEKSMNKEGQAATLLFDAKKLLKKANILAREAMVRKEKTRFDYKSYTVEELYVDWMTKKDN